MSELRDQMRRDAEALRSTSRGGVAGMDRVEAFERLFRNLPELVNDLEQAEAELAETRKTCRVLGAVAEGAQQRARQAETAIESAQEALTNALLEWQPEYEYRLDRAKRKGYSHDEIAVGTIGDAIKVASGVLAALGQPPVGVAPCVRIEPEMPGEGPGCATHNDVWPCSHTGQPAAPLGGQPPAEKEEDPSPCCDMHNPVVCESDEPGMDGPCCEDCPSRDTPPKKNQHAV
jgi:hypothetical protein